MITVAVRFGLNRVLGGEAPLLIFVLPVMVSAWYGGLWPGLYATALAGSLGTYWFVASQNNWYTTANQVRISLFLFEGLVTSFLTEQLHRAHFTGRALRGQLSGEQKRADHSEENFRLLIAAVKDYAIFMLDPQGHVQSWNAGAERIKGYTPEEIIGRHFSLFYVPKDVPRKPRVALETALSTGRYEEEGWRLRKDGSRFWASVVITPSFAEDGTLRGFAKVTRDITERKQAQDDLRAANESLEERVTQRTAQLEEVNQELQSFSYTVSHDLRAPLRSMQGFSQALVEDYGPALPAEAQEYIERVAAAGKRMEGLIQDLLDYSRLSRDELQLAKTSLDTVVRDSLQQLQQQIASTNANIDVAAPLPAVLAHHGTLTRMIANLISNAVKFVPRGTTPTVRVRSETENGKVRLWIEDQGIGIRPEHQKRIFNVFERLHGSETYPGTGIGLAIVRKGAERMGGRAGVESEEGQGSKFWIELPQG